MNKMLACAALVAACPIMPAFAEEVAPATRAAVRHADLDLASVAGIARLDRRISGAIETVCGEPVDYDLTGTNAIRRCRAQAREAVAPRRARLIASAGPAGTLAAR